MPIRRVQDIKRSQKRPLHAQLGYAAVVAVLGIAAAGVIAAGISARVQTAATADEIPVVRTPVAHAVDLSTCDRFAVITNVLDCGIFNKTDTRTCFACKEAGR